MVQLEGEARAAQQKAMQSVQECAAVQAALDKAHTELALTARRLTESEKTLAATQNRLKAVEASLAEAQADRQRLSAALDEANHKHLDAMNMQNSRFEALQARASLTENLLEEARQTLMARADEIRSFERRVIEASTAHDNTGEKLAQLAAALAEREAQIRESRAVARGAARPQPDAAHRGGGARRRPGQRAAEDQGAGRPMIELLEKQLQAARSANEMQTRSAQRAAPARAARTDHGRRRAGIRPQGHRPAAARDRAMQHRPDLGRRRSRQRAAQRGLSSIAFTNETAGANPAVFSCALFVTLPHQLPHRAVEPVQRQRIHPPAHQLLHHADRVGVAPTALSGTGLSQTQAG